MHGGARRRRALALVAVLALAARVSAADMETQRGVLNYGLWHDRVQTVYNLGEEGSKGLDMLNYAADDADWQVRLAAVQFLGDLGPIAAPALGEIVSLEPCPLVRVSALRSLAGMGASGRKTFARVLTPKYKREMQLIRDNNKGKRMGKPLIIDAPGGTMTAEFFNHGLDLRACASSEYPDRRLRPSFLARARRKERRDAESSLSRRATSDDRGRFAGRKTPDKAQAALRIAKSGAPGGRAEGVAENASRSRREEEKNRSGPATRPAGARINGEPFRSPGAGQDKAMAVKSRASAGAAESGRERLPESPPAEELALIGPDGSASGGGGAEARRPAAERDFVRIVRKPERLPLSPSEAPAVTIEPEIPAPRPRSEQRRLPVAEIDDFGVAKAPETLPPGPAGSRRKPSSSEVSIPRPKTPERSRPQSDIPGVRVAKSPESMPLAGPGIHHEPPGYEGVVPGSETTDRNRPASDIPGVRVAKSPETMPPGGPGFDPRATPEPVVPIGTAPDRKSLYGTAPRAPLPAGETMPAAGPGIHHEAVEQGKASFVADAGTGKPENDPIPELIRRLSSPEPRTRARAADELGKRGKAALTAVPALRLALKDRDQRVRASAVLALGGVGSSVDGVIGEIRSALRDKNEDVRFSAALALERIERKAPARDWGQR